MKSVGRLLAVLLAIAWGNAWPQAMMPVSVDFMLRAPGLAPDSKVYITGGVPSLGNWKPDAVRMEYQGNETWRAIVLFTSSMHVEYRYTLGSNEALAADERGQPLQNFSILARRQLDVNDTVLGWTDADTVVEAAGKITGDVRYHRYVKGEGVPPRDLVVWLPRFYDQRRQLDYPVLYLQDGQDLFDPATAHGGRDLRIDETMDRLIRDDIIEPMIVVGINAGDDRLEEYSPEDRGEAYMDYLVNTVKPLIERRYRVRQGRQHTLVGGAAMGGLIAFATAWKYPDQFGASIAMSPAFSIDGGLGDFAGFDATDWFVARQDESRRPVFFYFDNSGLGKEAESIQPGIDVMLGALEGWGYRWERDFVFIRDLDAYHGADAWAERFPEAVTKSLRGARRLHDLAGMPERDSAQRPQVQVDGTGPVRRDPQLGLLSPE